ncbi:hypothetical protein NAP1_06025 [Erythrobacter sp. NAP1]|uniref:hypothetical protein n=1 Tax=Erythrobacter sp. NAP1 TaxID=237727 RepID=UPI0000686C35
MSAALSTNPNFRSYRIAFGALSCTLLAIPLLAMQLTGEVNWQIGDFVVAALMLLTLGAVIELVARFVSGRALRATAIAIALAGFVFVWAMLATG